MKVQVFGCSHRTASLAIRERVAFSHEQTRSALDGLRRVFPRTESVLLSTCNRVELYMASENGATPTGRQVAEFVGRFHCVDPGWILEHFVGQAGREAVRHLFLVASSLDSMVVGEPQILAQVKQAYQLAIQQASTGPLTHAAFQTAVKVARRVASETAVHQRRVSIPSVAVTDFAKQIFERFNDKQTLVVGAGEMAEETLRYLEKEGACRVTIVNRSLHRAADLARQCGGRPRPWEDLLESFAEADLVISATGATQPIVTLEQFMRIEPSRAGRVLFVLDLAVPRDFDPRIGDRPGVYLYSIDDLQAACERNRQARDRELPKAMTIIEQETNRFLAELHHRAVAPVIRRLRADWERVKDDELRRLFNKVPALDGAGRGEVSQSFERLVNKLLHPPLESLRVESRHGVPHMLLDSLSRLFQLKD